ncbi:MAG: PAS domain S-box protein [Verrucomicrobia bacterium]|nr:PAS domain S-box protein [Verrucomicrobiota bacterium]
MSIPLNLLIIEDKSADFRLIVRHLEKHGLTARCHCVSSIEELEAAVEQGGWDAVLSDYSVPKLDFEHTLGLLRARHPDLPLILVSGSVGEEKAVELLKLGVWDFVLKDNLTRLVPAIERGLRDATDRLAHRQAQEAQRASELRYRRLFEAAKDGILILDAKTGIVVDVNPFLIEMLGYTHEVFLGKRVWELGFFKDILANQDNFAKLQEKEYIRYEDMALETADGRRIDVEFVSNVYLVNHHKVIQCNIRDISARKRAEAALHLALAEKTSLVMEIHHRVKNNLAIMVGLMNMQAHQIKHPEALAALADTKARLFSMSLLHEMLYSAGRMDQVEIQSYLQRLCRHISQSHGLSALGIQIQNSPSAPLTVGIDQAVPCGLIVSELVSNTIKHAFPNDRQGKVTVDMVLAAPDIVTLRVTDDGIGLPDDLQIDQIGTLGLPLVDALTHQLRGTLEIQRGLGTTFEIRFPLQPTTPA